MYNKLIAEKIYVCHKNYVKSYTFAALVDWFMQPGSFRPIDDWSRLPDELKEIDLIYQLLSKEFEMSYQIYQILRFAIKYGLNGTSMIEIGGSMPNTLLFDILNVASYVSTESPDYVQEVQGFSCSDSHGAHPRRRNLSINAEDIYRSLTDNCYERAFSVACFEHILDLESALKSIYSVLKKSGIVYSMYAPIFSNIHQGHHGCVPTLTSRGKYPLGFYLLDASEQLAAILSINPSSQLSDVTADLEFVNHSRKLNRLLYEDYVKLVRLSDFCVLSFESIDNWNDGIERSKLQHIYAHNNKLCNSHTLGIAMALIKG
jgi:hypothetical protein